MANLTETIRNMPSHFTPALLAHALVYGVLFGAGWLVSAGKGHHPSACPWPEVCTFIIRSRADGLSAEGTLEEALRRFQQLAPGEVIDIDVLRDLANRLPSEHRPAN